MLNYIKKEKFIHKIYIMPLGLNGILCYSAKLLIIVVFYMYSP